MTLWLEWKNPASYLSWLVRDIVGLIQVKVTPSFWDLLINPPSQILKGRPNGILTDLSYIYVNSSGVSYWFDRGCQLGFGENLVRLPFPLADYQGDNELLSLDRNGAVRQLNYSTMTTTTLYVLDPITLHPPQQDILVHRWMNRTHLVTYLIHQNIVYFHVHHLATNTLKFTHSYRITEGVPQLQGKYFTVFLSSTHLFIERPNQDTLGLNLETGQIEYRIPANSSGQITSSYEGSLVLRLTASVGELVDFITHQLIKTFTLPSANCQLHVYVRNNRFHLVIQDRDQCYFDE